MVSPNLGRHGADARVRGQSAGTSGTAVAFAVTVAALYFGREVFVPVALAILLSFLLAPLVLLLRRVRFGRVPSVVVAVLVAFTVICGIAGLIGDQVARLAGNLPEYESTISQKIEALQDTAAGSSIVERASTMLGDLRRQISRTTENASKAVASASNAASPGDQQKPIPVEIHSPPAAPLEVIRTVIGPLWGPLGTAGIVLVFVVFILLQREDLRDRFIRLVGARDLHRTTEALDDGVSRLSRYFLTQSAINATFGIVIGIGLFFIGVPNPVLWGILAMLLRFVPYIGPVIAALFPAALAIAVDPHWSMLFWTIGLFAVVEPIMGQVVEPLVNSRSTGLSAVAVVVAAAFWTWLWGPVGLLLSTPLTVCLVVIGRHVERLQFLDVLLGDRPALAPEQSFYQRMLAGDPDEAAHYAEEFLKQKSLSSYYDEIAIRGLALAQLDVERGVLDHEHRVQVKEAIEGLVDNLSDHADVPPESNGAAEPVAAAETQQPAVGKDPAILCVAGRGSLDEAVSAILAQLLEKHGVGARVVSSQEASPARIYRLDATGIKMVCLSYLASGGFTNARYLVRRLRRALPGTRILLGLWAQGPVEIDRDRILKETEADIVATSLAQAMESALAETGQDVAGTLPTSSPSSVAASSTA
jgi:predicted PurR-regulated permease PerM